MKWQPIETAPKDGTVIFLAKNVEVVAGWWNPKGDGDRGVDWHFIEDTEFVLEGCCDREAEDHIIPNGWIRKWPGPTHWMPLPEPPNA